MPKSWRRLIELDRNLKSARIRLRPSRHSASHPLARMGVLQNEPVICLKILRTKQQRAMIVHIRRERRDNIRLPFHGHMQLHAHAQRHALAPPALRSWS